MVRNAVFALAFASVAANAQGPVVPSGQIDSTAEEQITQAVLPLPNDLRASATVLGYAPDGKLVSLRRDRAA